MFCSKATSAARIVIDIIIVIIEISTTFIIRILEPIGLYTDDNNGGKRAFIIAGQN